MSKNKYQCCFCGKEIESNSVDITSIIVIANWDKEEEKQQDQQFFCHLDCFTKCLFENVPLYLPN